MSKLQNNPPNSKFFLKENLGLPTAENTIHQRDYPAIYQFLKESPTNLQELEEVLSICRAKEFRLADQVILSFSLSEFPRMKQILAIKRIYETFYNLMWHPLDVYRALQRMVRYYDFNDGLDNRFGPDLLIIEELRTLFLVAHEGTGDIDMEELFAHSPVD